MTPRPDPTDALAHVQHGWAYLQLQSPLAAWASWQQALRLEPGNRAALQALERLASAHDLPDAARATYRFRQPRGEQRRLAWDAALRNRDLQILTEASSAFAAIVAEEPTDAPAHYNQALCLAWLGRNSEAIDALDATVNLDAADHSDESVDAWTLAAVLRQGAGAEPLADDFDHALIVPWRTDDPDPSELAPIDTVRPVSIPTNDLDASRAPFEDVQVSEWLDRPMLKPSDVSSHADLPRVLATVLRASDALRFSSPRASSLQRIEELLSEDLPADEHLDRRSTPLPLSLLDAAVWTIRLPIGLDEPTRARLTREAVEHYYESIWIFQPLMSLAGISPDSTPAGAARSAGRGDAVARVKLAAAVRFREQLGERPSTAALYAGYPFDRLRNRLGLETLDPFTLDTTDPSCLNPSQLRALDPATLDASTLADAFHSARLFGDDDLTARFNLALNARRATPPHSED